jgi:hypothetical protein
MWVDMKSLARERKSQCAFAHLPLFEHQIFNLQPSTTIRTANPFYDHSFYKCVMNHDVDELPGQKVQNS